MLKVSPRKGIIRFGKREKLNIRYIRPFKILKRFSPLAYKLELPEELSNVHNTFHVSNLKKCLFDESLVIPMKELRLDDKLNFVEELVEIMDREVKQLKQSRIPIIKMKHKRIQMSSMGELTFFLGLQVQHKEDGIFISQNKYVADILKNFDFTTIKATSTLIETNKALNKDEEAEDQTIVANSTTEAEYDASRRQIAMAGVKNPVFHSKTKHIEIRNHLIGDSYEKKLVQVIKIYTNHNVTDLLTKAFDVNRVDTPLFQTMLVQGKILQGEGSTIPVESHHTPISAPSTSQPPTSPPSMQTTHVAEEAATMPHDSPLLRKGQTYKEKKLEHKVKSSKARRRVRLVVSENEDELEDPSKYGRKIAQIDEDGGITLVQMSAKVSNTSSPELEECLAETFSVYTEERSLNLFRRRYKVATISRKAGLKKL
ncbi:hypothetical protein Tco_0625828 [Tanacetum coccineum]|uniref:Tf2-1-like SH3-like domain-containing protein n=1 Tax=Tanacetum coccineum TaxID=301880 RepID=A0ABQ4WHY5_9ASTR